jgi:hypothetical protein
LSLDAKGKYNLINMKGNASMFRSKTSLSFVTLLLTLVAACSSTPTATPERISTSLPTATIANTSTPMPTTAPSSTPTISPTSIPTSIPTATTKPSLSASPTRSSLPNLSSLALKLQDLPSGFEEVSLADLGISEKDVRQSLEIESAFAFRISTPAQFQTVKGFSTSLPARMRDTNDKERLRSQTNILVDSFAKGYTLGSKSTVSELVMPESIGDIAAGRTFVVKLDQPGLEKYAVRTDIVVFQRNIATIILLVEYVDGFTPAIKINDLAKILDKRIVDTFVASIATSTPKPTLTSPGTQTMGTPVASWDGLPIISGAIEGRPAGPSYAYSVRVSVTEAEAYYQKYMSETNWKLTNRQSSDTSMFGGPSVVLDFTRGDHRANVMLIFSSKENYTMVLLTMVK